MRVAVFCGASHGNEAQFRIHTEQLAQALARARIDLVYGGGKVGLMGVLADAALAAGAHVIGVMPQHLVAHELAHPGLAQLLVVDDMHQRKAAMAQHADAFIALPGGPGTLEELFEAWTWAQLGLHAKPCALLNVDGYFDGLLAFCDHMITKGFMRPAYKDMLIVAEDAESLLRQLASYQAPPAKWQAAAAPQAAG